MIKNWFRLWLGAKKAISHYFNHWWFSVLTCICVTWPQSVKNWCQSIRGNLSSCWVSEQSPILTLEQLEMHECIFSTVATDVLVLKHQAISIHSVDQLFIVLELFYIKSFHSQWTTPDNKITYWKEWSSCLRVKCHNILIPTISLFHSHNLELWNHRGLVRHTYSKCINSLAPGRF